MLCGSEDSVTPQSDHEQLVAAMRDAGGQPKYVLVPGAGHLPPMENPAEVNSAMVEFLGSI
ncbi:MAG: alpha/beta hydrolase [Actinobacteria bacterium]|nr:alpha/beta hydrolase [Actinomycetota bacterium]